MYQYILTQITLTLHFKSGIITLATATSLLPMPVSHFAGSMLPLCSLLDCQATQARLATPKLPQPCVNLINVLQLLWSSTALSALTSREIWIILVLAVLVRDCRSSVTIQRNKTSGGFCQPCSWCEPCRDTVQGMVHKTWPPQHLPYYP